MSILVKNKKSEKKAFCVTAAAALLCMLTTCIYYRFSHEVYSDYMSYMFLVPIVFGTLFYGTMVIWRTAPEMNRVAFNIYNSGIATLTVACMLRGVLNIAGADSPYVVYFLFAGIVMLLIGLFIYAAQCIKE